MKGSRGQVETLFKRDSADMDRRRVRWGLMVWVVALGAWFPAQAEFFKYTDQAGRTYYVDEAWKVPEPSLETAFAIGVDPKK